MTQPAPEPIGTPAMDGVRKSRDQILDAAARFLRQNGYHATTLRGIAAAVGIKAGSIYYHFGSKNEIVAAVMNEGVDHVFRAVDTALAVLPADAAPEVRLRVAIRAHLGALLKLSDYTSAGLKSYGEVPAEIRELTRPHRRKYEALWEDLIKSLFDAGITPEDVPADTMRLAILGMMNWSPEWYRSNRHSIDDIAADFARIVCNKRS